MGNLGLATAAPRGVLREAGTLTTGFPRRITATLGFVGALLSLVAVAAAGDTPDPHESSASMASYFIRHRAQILAAAPAGYLGAAAIAGFVLIVASQLRAVGQQVAAVTVVVGAVVAVTYLVLLQVAYTSIAFNIRASSVTAPALFLPTILAVPAWGLAVSLTLLGVAYATWKTQLFPPWHLCLSLGGGLVSAVALVAHGDSGYLYPDVQQQYVGQVLIIWLAATAVAVWMAGSRSRSRVEPLG